MLRLRIRSKSEIFSRGLAIRALCIIIARLIYLPVRQQPTSLLETFKRKEAPVRKRECYAHPPDCDSLILDCQGKWQAARF